MSSLSAQGLGYWVIHNLELDSTFARSRQRSSSCRPLGPAICFKNAGNWPGSPAVVLTRRSGGAPRSGALGVRRIENDGGGRAETISHDVMCRIRGARVPATLKNQVGSVITTPPGNRQTSDRADFHASEERFRLLVDSVTDYAIFILDQTGHVSTWNTGAERIKGYSAHEIIGKHFSTFYPPEVAVSGKCEMELEVAAREGRFEEEGWRLRKDGSRFWANVTITALRQSDGNLIGFAKVTRDLTERRARRKKLGAFDCWSRA